MQINKPKIIPNKNMDKSLLPPALAPAPPLTEDEVTEQWRAIFDVEDSGWEWGRRLRRWTETKMQGKRSEGRSG
ncbi:uncharacterized protein HKW66_Vig0228790 [Vigna angularis]|uniref:Uncharacterized protein n=1 Tax=Phaseolus angularis TaxID=3914 RepID=A0A8T0KAG9_PHAAN|nr:uncharacterized protein HKW66_Vig0228790 [Vigna angularis]